VALVIKNLWVKDGNISLAGKTVPFWGFAPSGGGTPILPGPLIEAEVGDMIWVNLHNRSIPYPVSVMFPGQENVFTRSGLGLWARVRPQYENNVIVSLTDYLEPGQNMPVRYLFQAVKPGVYLFESGTSPELQVQMGLWGILIVRPKDYSSQLKTAYGANTGSEFDVEQVLVVSDVDSTMHTALNQGISYNLLDYAPDCWLINGRSCPDTLKNDDDADLPNQPYSSLISAKVGQRVLLRIINAGFLNHTLQLGGLTGRVVAGDSFSFISATSDVSYQKTAITLGAGQSFDVILIPETPGEYYFYAREYGQVVNDDIFPGGMMTKMTVTP
jgi:FtsP/CotA-like multicopper oxidase with cupredoxin domain